LNWIGQHIVSLIARFRSDVYLEDISTGTIASGSHLGLDSNNKIVKAVDGGGDLTSIVAGTGLSGTSLTGPIPTLNVDASQTQITSVGTIGAGVWQGTTIKTDYIGDDQITEDKLANTLLAEIDANTAKVTNSDQSKADINALDITEVGTISSGVWQGTTIKTVYIGDDQITEDKLANTLLAEIDANTAKNTNVTTNLGISGSTDARTITSSDGTNAVIPVATTSVSGVMSTAIFDAVTANTAKVTNSDQTKADINALDITEVGTISSGQWRGDAIASAYIADDAVTEDKLANALLAEIDANTAKVTRHTLIDSDAFTGASSSNVASAESIKAYADTKVASAAQKQLTYYFMHVDIDTTKTYIGLQEADAESTSSTNKNLPILAPFAGKLLKVFLRADGNLSAKTLTWRLETNAAGSTTLSAPTVVGTQSGAGCTNATMTTYDFTSSLDSGDNIIDAGDTIQLSVQSDATTNNTKYYITCLWEWDLS
jgi:hypothetical protein